MKGLRNRVEEIIRGLDSGEFEDGGDHPEFQEDIDTIAEICDDYSENTVDAILTAVEKMSAHVRVDELKEFIQEHFRGYFLTHAKAIRGQVRDQSDMDELTWLDKYDQWIDWESYATSPDMSDYTFVEIDGVSGGFLFRD